MPEQQNKIRLFATINQPNSDFFSRQATAKPFSLLRSIYIMGLAHQFWLDLDNSFLDVFNKPRFGKYNSLICNY